MFKCVRLSFSKISLFLYWSVMLHLVSLLIPYPSVQHFVWPLHWCLLADICNHTWIPECGSENDEDVHSRRLFIDECDMYEYNCDFFKDYYPINYSDCFNLKTTPCPPQATCPTCPHGLRVGPHSHPRILPVKPTTLGVSLPLRMLKGKRRYTPQRRKMIKQTTRSLKMYSNTKKVVRTMILRTQKIMKNGKMMVKIIKAFVRKQKGSNKDKGDSDFLE